MIKKLFSKIHNKFKNLIKNVFRNTEKSVYISIFFVSLIISSMYSYYISDYVGSYLSILITLTIFISIALSIFYKPIKKIVVYLKKIKSFNLISLVALYIFIYYFLGEVSYTYPLLDFEYQGVIFVSTLVVFLFSKSIAVFLNRKSFLSIVLILVTAVPVVGIFYFLSFPGFDTKEDYNFVAQNVKSENLYQVQTINYDEETMDLTGYVSYSGKKKKRRDMLFSHSLTKAPIRGVMYKPVNDEKKDVLFIVHGNHRATTKSHLGYEYLVRYLAERGIAVVSVDMNYLNGFLNYGLSGENDARAMALYRNIDYILNLEENRDLNKEIFLAGHSRGAEATTILKSFTELEKLPEDGNRNLSLNVKIKGIISISGTYGQYTPAGKNLKLRNVNFLCIHGTHDSDVEGFEQLNQYENIENSRGYFKSAIYIPYANHGNFNTLWGDYDLDPPDAYFFNRKSLLPGEDQRRILEVLTEKFIRAVYGKESKKIFYDLESEDLNIPKLDYYQMYQEGGSSVIANFDEDYNISTATNRNFDMTYQGFSQVYEDMVEVGDADYNSGLYLRSTTSANLSFFAREDVAGLKNLSFDIIKKDDGGSMEVTVMDYFGRKYSYDISKIKTLPKETWVERSKIEHIKNDGNSYMGYTTIKLDLSDAKASGVDTSRIRYIDFNFKGANDLILDNILFSD